MANSTQKQKEASKRYLIDLKNHRRMWDNSNCFTKSADNLRLLREVIGMTVKLKQDKLVLDEKREQLKNVMSGVTNQVYDLDSGMMACISKPGSYTSYKFDEAAFKAENPELYKKYVKKYPNFSSGGNLTIRRIGDKSLEIFKKFEEDADIISIEELKHQYPYGDIMKIESYLDCVTQGYFTSYDGSGVYLDKQGKEHECSSFNPNDIKAVMHKYPYVAWFNR